MPLEPKFCKNGREIRHAAASRLGLAFCLLLLEASSVFAGSLEMTCQHAVVPEMPEIVLYVTLHNAGTEPVQVITFLPNAGVAIRGGAWMFALQSTWYSEDNGTGKIPIRERLLPLLIPPRQSITFSQKFSGSFFEKLPQIEKNTYVHCRYKVTEKDAKRYGVWGGELSAKSEYVPFYEEK